MPLPKVGYPIFELQLPSNGKTIKYRPFIVKEEKVLLLALESEDENQVKEAVKNLIKNCVITKIKVDELPAFDLEYLFLRIRAAAVGEIVTMNVICKDDNETEIESIEESLSDKITYKQYSGLDNIEQYDSIGSRLSNQEKSILKKFKNINENN